MAYYQLENGELLTAKQYARLWPGGKKPTPRQRQMLGIETLTKAQYEKAKTAHLPAKRYRRGKGGKKVWLNPGLATLRREKYATGKWMVYTKGDYPRRVGHIVGGNKKYLAEMGPETLGSFPTLVKATRAIEKELSKKSLQPQKTRKNPSHGRGSRGSCGGIRKFDGGGQGQGRLHSNPRNLPAFRITTSSGHSWVTSMAKDVTLQKAKDYFLGQRVDVGVYPREKMEKVVKVTKVRSNPGPGETSYGVDPNAVTRKLKPYKPAKPKKGSSSTTRRMKAMKNPLKTYTWHISGYAKKKVTGKGTSKQDAFTRLSKKDRQLVTLGATHTTASNPHRMGSLTWARAVVKDYIKRGDRGPWIIGHYTTGGMPRYEVKGGIKWAKMITQPSGVHFWYPEEVWIGEPKKSGKGLKAVKVQSQVKKTFGSKNPPSLYKDGVYLCGLAKMAALADSGLLPSGASSGTLKGRDIIKSWVSQNKKHLTVKKRGGVSWLLYKGKSLKSYKKKNPPPLPSTVVPAYGRDYTSKEKVIAAWERGTDFIISDIMSPWDGKPISIRDFPVGSSVNIRYGKLRKVLRYTKEKAC